MTESETRAQRKAWRQRNSDGRATFERIRTQAPPTIAEEEHALPDTPHKLTSPDNADDARAIRHVHVYDPSLSDPDA